MSDRTREFMPGNFCRSMRSKSCCRGNDRCSTHSAAQRKNYRLQNFIPHLPDQHVRLRNFVHCGSAVIGVVGLHLYVWIRAGLRGVSSRFRGLRRVRHSRNTTGPLDCDPPKTWPSGSPASWANFLRLPRKARNDEIEMKRLGE
jgi:hypothetical protein